MSAFPGAGPGYAQSGAATRLDSLRQLLQVHAGADTTRASILRGMAAAYLESDPAAGIPFAQQSLQLAVQLRWKDGTACALMQLGDQHRFLDHKTEALGYYNLALPLFRTMGGHRQIAAILFAIGDVYYFQSELAQALQYCFFAVKYSELYSLPVTAAKAYATIGKIYSDKKQYPESAQYLKASLRLLLSTGELRNAGLALSDLGRLYANMGDYKTGMAYTTQSMNVLYQAGDTGMAISSKAQLANHLLFLKDYAHSLQLVNETIADSRYIYNPGDKVYVRVTRASVLLNYMPGPAHNRQAAADLQAARLLLHENPNLLHTRDLYQQLVVLYRQEGKVAEEYAAYKAYTALADSLDKADMNVRIQELTALRTVGQQQHELEEQQEHLREGEQKRKLFIGGIFSLLAVTVIILRQSRLRKQAMVALAASNKRLDEANRVKTRFLSILSHDLRSPVANLVSFLNLQRQAPGLLDAASKAKHQARIGDAAANLLAVMEDLLLWSKGQMDSFKPQITTVQVLHLYGQLRQLLPPDSATELLLEDPQLLAVRTDENFLKTIMRNLTANAATVLQGQPGGKIIWRAWAEADGRQYLSITDNGPGLSAAQAQSLFQETSITSTKGGLGLHLVRDFANTLGLQLKVDSAPGQGTTFTMQLGL